MDFGLNEIQQDIKRAANDFLSDRFRLERVRELAESGAYDAKLWGEVCELGWPGIAVTEAHGGQGLGTVELAILAEEIGFAAAPMPFLSNAAAGLLLERAGSSEQKERWLPGVASGEGTGTVGVVANGTAPLVPDADDAAFVILVDGEKATLLERDAATVDPVDTIDMTRRYSQVGGGQGENLPRDPAAGLDTAAVALSAELTGIAQRAMEMAVDYAKEREQFERPIGAYQAVSHACAKMLLDTEEARSLTYYAAWAAEAEPESLPLAASMAKARATDAAWSVTAASLQVHGGIGFTWEHNLHLFLKRAKTAAHLFGTPREHRERVAELAGLGAASGAAAPAAA